MRTVSVPRSTACPAGYFSLQGAAVCTGTLFTGDGIIYLIPATQASDLVTARMLPVGHTHCSMSVQHLPERPRQVGVHGVPVGLLDRGIERTDIGGRLQAYVRRQRPCDPAYSACMTGLIDGVSAASVALLRLPSA